MKFNVEGNVQMKLYVVSVKKKVVTLRLEGEPTIKALAGDEIILNGNISARNHK